MRKLLLTAGLAAGLLTGVLQTPAGAEPTRAPTGAPTVATDAGVLRGAATGTTDQFLGVPYAAPPVQQRRWKPPQPVARWKGVRSATRLSARCIQNTTAPTSEDCLYLNVYTPKGASPSTHRYPVMVYIHGGAFVSGTGSNYDPTTMVERGAIVVTLNYRLGALGFLAHPALAAADGSAGNYGLMDQQAALRWVQRNIGRFGGQANRVTIFGESAGGDSVLAHLTSPGSAGLFSAAIAQSGAYNLKLQSRADAETDGEALAAAAGCPDQTAACLRSLPASALLAQQKSILYLQTDGAVLPRSLDDAFRSGAFHHVPVINGTTHDESTYFVATGYDLAGQRVTAENYLAGIQAMTGVSPAAAKRVAQRYPLTASTNPASALAAAATDASFACPALQLDGWLSKRVPTYAYEFNDRNAPQLYLPPVSFPYGASHASELQYLFTVGNAVYPAALSKDQQALAATMRKHWTNFAKDRQPADKRTWPLFSGAAPQMISYAPSRLGEVTDFSREHNCDLWASLQ
ncbi:carboxylesterase/lipase family protein [Actinomadura opuntiae]|uniref:carboxylesterase/lipase family protein n=1 Tax=Actinomadura sp. OS1-43 TaxID=604315 RepID=UPI00255AB3CD|nr:carboxylesterase family protein [Actinomadura sp. OS1-43]MDL4821109.1 carboxylesterase family protein [Actinomadura sp. OS1-43]